MRVGQQGSLSRIWADKGTRPRAIRQQQYLSTYILELPVLTRINHVH